MAERKRLTPDEKADKIENELHKRLESLVSEEIYNEAIEYAGNLCEEKKVDKETGKETNSCKYSVNTVIEKTIKKYTPTSTMSMTDRIRERSKKRKQSDKTKK